MVSSEHGRSADAQVRSGLPELLGRLWRYGVVLTKDKSAADDLVQATCLRALEKCNQFQPGTRLDRWTFSILSSIWFNELRSQRVRRGHGQVDAEITLVSDGQSEVETNILANQVLSKVQALPESQRVAVFLVYVEGLTYAEAAEMLSVPAGTIMSRLATARAKLAHLNALADGDGETN